MEPALRSNPSRIRKLWSSRGVGSVVELADRSHPCRNWISLELEAAVCSFLHAFHSDLTIVVVLVATCRRINLRELFQHPSQRCRCCLPCRIRIASLLKQ